MFDKFHEECAVMGVYGHPEAANLVYLGLYALQHRGQESCGIVSSDGKGLISHRQMGLVADVFREDVIKRLEGSRAIGHNRYSTTGQSHLKNAQPFVVEYSQGPIAISHNGNLVNAEMLRKELEDSGSIFQSTSDTEVIIHLIATSKESTLMGRIVEALSRTRGAYSLLFLTLDRMIAARDPMGFRPLVVGRFNSGPNEGAYVVASETCALDLIEATYEREVEPGEIITFSANGMESLKPFPPAPSAKCIFEYIYFSRPDSKLYGHNVYQVRKALGPTVGPRKRGGSGSCDARAGLRSTSRHWLCRGVGYTAGVRADPQPLRGPDVYRTAAIDPAFWREDQTQRAARGFARKARRRGGRFHHSRDHQPQDHPDASRCRRERSAHAD